MTVSVVVPTYNERENIGDVVTSLDEALTADGYEYEIVVVDDDSPDRTWAVARDLADDYPITVVRRRGERGLATAVLRGFEEANHDVICVMDGDGQHPAGTVPKLIEAYLADDVDIVVGSRLTESGSFGRTTWVQHAQTYVANALAWLVLPETRSVRDVQSGFFVVSREVVESVELAPRGYKILLELLVMTDHAGATEVGYTFNERRKGESKLGAEIVLAYLLHLGSLWRRKRGLDLSIGGVSERVASIVALPRHPANRK